jgi:hypothetical protein
LSVIVGSTLPLAVHVLMRLQSKGEWGIDLKLKRKNPNPERHSNKLRNVERVVTAMTVVASLIAIIGITLHQAFTSTGPYRVEYKGKVVDKSLRIMESELGSYPVRRLHIRQGNGSDFYITVDASLYERA